jgi:elongation factor P
VITANDLRKGTTIELDGEVYMVVEFQHVKPGKGGAFVRSKLKSLKTNQIIDKTFRSEEKIKEARIYTKKAQYLYRDSDQYWFMDSETFEQISLSKETVGHYVDFLVENEDVDILHYENRIIGIELPTAVVLEVTHTEPGVKGDTVSGGSKPATLQTGVVIQVPLFINTGDKIKIDTRTGEYIERA